MTRVKGWGGLDAALFVLIATAILFRLIDLANLPGLNGDEAWYGVQVLRWSAGEPVDWRTPSGNLIGFAHPAGIWLLHWVFDPAPWILRAPSVVSSVLEIAVVARVAWKHLGPAAAAAGAGLCAALPVNIAYARFGWEPSHSGLFLSIAAALALRGSMIGTALSFAASLFLHPTNVVAGPFLALAFCGSELSRGDLLRASLRSGALVLVLAALFGAFAAITNTARAVPAAGAIWSRLHSPGAWGAFAERLAGFISGDLTYRYIAGSPLPLPAWTITAVFWIVVAAALAAGLWRVVRARRWLELGLIAGGCASAGAFFAIAGPDQLAPHVERFALVLVVPLMFAFLAAVFGAVPRERARPGLGATAAICVALLAGFYVSYFRELWRTGSRSHQTFWTGPREPKAQAAEFVLRERSPGAPAVVLADSWWVRWPVEYLTRAAPEVSVVTIAGRREIDARADIFAIGFPGGSADSLAASYPPGAFHRFSIRGYGRDAVLHIWHRPPSDAQDGVRERIAPLDSGESSQR